ncbi:JEMB [Bacillus thuringiensis IBL 200]|nr:JEMB [Bacillus thuringiensis IBL 200]
MLLFFFLHAKILIKGGIYMENASQKANHYYAVIFTSNLSNDTTDYNTVAEKMEELAKQQPGFLGVESARGNSGLGITISYWESLDAIENWKKNALHKEAKKRGREQWYENFHLRICLVEKEFKFQRGTI